MPSKARLHRPRKTGKRHDPVTTVKRISGRRLQKRRWLYLMEHPLCVECRKEGRAVAADEIDHITPLFKGGTDEPDNWQGLCRRHHYDKSAREQGGTGRRIGLDGLPVGVGRKSGAD